MKTNEKKWAEFYKVDVSEDENGTLGNRTSSKFFFGIKTSAVVKHSH